MTTKSYVGKKVTLKAGTRYNVEGFQFTRETTRKVTVLKQATDRRGKTRIFWKSNGYLANALIG